MPVIAVPHDDLYTFKYSPRADFVGCSTGRSVLIENCKTQTLTPEQTEEMLASDEQEKQKILKEINSLFKNYQRQAKGFQLVWSDQYQLAKTEQDEAQAIRSLQLSDSDEPGQNMQNAVEYLKTQIKQ